MIENKWHISADGIPRPCKAKGKCPLGGEESHFNTEKEAIEFSQGKMEKEYGTLNPVKANSLFTKEVKSGLEYYEVGGDLSTREFVNDFEEAYGEFSPGEKEEIAIELSKALWNKYPKANLSRVPKMKDYIVEGKGMLEATSLHRKYKASPELLQKEIERNKVSGTMTVAHYNYEKMLKDNDINLDKDVDVNIYAIENKEMDWPNGLVADAEFFKREWGVSSLKEVIDKHGSLITPTRYEFYKDDTLELTNAKNSLIKNMHKPIEEWDSRPNTIAIQDESGTVSIYYIEDEDYLVDNKVKDDKSLFTMGFRGTPERITVRNPMITGTYKGSLAEKLIRDDLVNFDLRPI